MTDERASHVQMCSGGASMTTAVVPALREAESLVSALSSLLQDMGSAR